MMRSYSSAVRPWLRASSFVTLGSAPVPPSPLHHSVLPLEKRPVLDQAGEEGMEDGEPVDAAHRLLGGALRMGHQTKYRPLFVDDARDIVERAIGIGVLGEAPVFLAVTEDHLALLFQRPEGGAVAVVLPLTVRDRHLQHLAGTRGPREGGLGVVHADVHELAAVLEGVIPGQRAREEPGLAQDLEAVAGAEHQPAPRHELRQGLDDGGAPGHRTGPKIVAIGEAPGEHQAIVPGEIRLPMPDIADRLAEHFADDIVEVAVAPRAREDHHTESHGSWSLLLC